VIPTAKPPSTTGRNRLPYAGKVHLKFVLSSRLRGRLIDYCVFENKPDCADTITSSKGKSTISLI
jgi:hypothetical protein